MSGLSSAPRIWPHLALYFDPPGQYRHDFVGPSGGDGPAPIDIVGASWRRLYSPKQYRMASSISAILSSDRCPAGLLGNRLASKERIWKQRNTVSKGRVLSATDTRTLVRKSRRMFALFGAHYHSDNQWQIIDVIGRNH